VNHFLFAFACRIQQIYFSFKYNFLGTFFLFLSWATRIEPRLVRPKYKGKRMTFRIILYSKALDKDRNRRRRVEDVETACSLAAVAVAGM
jgi:hypothetical protein